MTKFVAAPTAVALGSFVARRRGAIVLLRWRTGSESRLLGFNVYRGRTRLHRVLIAARSTSAGSSYSYVDRTAPRVAPLRYRLQGVGLDGARSWMGTVFVAAR